MPISISLVKYSKDIQLKTYNWIEQFLQKRGEFKVTLICTLLTFIFYFPDYDLLEINRTFYQAIDRQIAYPFEQETYELPSQLPESSHFAKRKFRLTIPVIANVLHINACMIFICQQFLVGLFFLMVYKLTKSITGDIITAFFATLSFCFTYVSKSFLFYMPLYDCFAYLFLVCAFYFKKPLLIFVFIILAAFTDERALAASALVLFFHKLELVRSRSILIKDLFVPEKSSYAVIAGCILYLAVRFILNEHYYTTSSIRYTDVGFNVIASNFSFIPLASFLSLEGFWLLVIITVIIWLYTRKYLELFFFSVTLLLILLIGFSVFDITRSTAYVFPVVFVALQVVFSHLKSTHCRSLLLIVLMLCFITPTYLLWGGEDKSVFWLSPVFPKILKYLQ